MADACPQGQGVHSVRHHHHLRHLLHHLLPSSSARGRPASPAPGQQTSGDRGQATRAPPNAGQALPRAGGCCSHPIAIGEHGVKEAVQVSVQTLLAARLPKFPVCGGMRRDELPVIGLPQRCGASLAAAPGDRAGLGDDALPWGWYPSRDGSVGAFMAGGGGTSSKSKPCPSTLQRGRMRSLRTLWVPDPAPRQDPDPHLCQHPSNPGLVFPPLAPRWGTHPRVPTPGCPCRGSQPPPMRRGSRTSVWESPGAAPGQR